MRSTYFTALIVAAIVIAWLVSGQLSEDAPAPPATIAEQNRTVALQAEEKPPVAVRVATSYAQIQAREIKIRGETLSRRLVEVKSQIAGTVIERVADRGDRVEAGDPLCKISEEDRLVALEDSKQALAQARIEFEGSQRLAKEGLQSQTLIAQARARLASAEASFKRSQLDVERLSIRAPFSGIIEQVPLELGDLVSPGVTCATLVALDPMLLTGRVSELEVSRLSLGAIGKARLSTGEIVAGTVSFIGKVADAATRTYAVELEIENEDYRIASGLTAEVAIPVQEILAHRVSPALLSLDDEGNIGVRTINDENEVEFYLVNIVRQDQDGLWISGLPEVTTLITVGQELVVAGEVVVPTYESLETAQPNDARIEPPATVAVEVKSS